MPADRCARHDVPTVRIDVDPGPVTVGSVIDHHLRVEVALSANVFVATELGRGARVVLKTPRIDTADREVAWARFFQEACTLLAIDDPHVVSARALAVEPGSERVYLLLEHLPGGTLEQRIQSGPLDVPTTVAIARDLARGLSALHARGVVHRDLKPSNVAFDVDGRAVLIDVGHAKLEESEAAPPLTAPGQALGTPAYMAPEGISGGTLDPRADLYALGCVVFAMLGGAPPFGRGSPVEVMRRHLRDAPGDLPAAAPAELRALVGRLLAKSKLERPDSAADVLTLLDGVPHARATGVATPKAAAPTVAADEADYTAVLPRPLDAPPGATVTKPATVHAPAPLPPPRRVSIIGVVAIAVVLSLVVVVARLWFERVRPRPVPARTTDGPRAEGAPTARPRPVAVSKPELVTSSDAGVRRRPLRAAGPRSVPPADAGVRPLLRIPELDP